MADRCVVAFPQCRVLGPVGLEGPFGGGDRAFGPLGLGPRAPDGHAERPQPLRDRRHLRVGLVQLV